MRAQYKTAGFPLLSARRNRRNIRRIANCDTFISWLFCLHCIGLGGLSVGCNSLAPGNVSAITSPTSVSNSSSVILIRGWRDLWSDGIDRLGEKLKASGFDANVFKESQASEVSAAMVARAKTGVIPPPVVLIGFSYGADDVIQLSRKLDEVHQPVDLLILIDPVTPAAIPPNVRRCINFYQSNGVWDAFPWLRGVPVTGEPGHPIDLQNIDIRARADLAEPDTAHKTIAGSLKLHDAILAEVRKTSATAATRPSR